MGHYSEAARQLLEYILGVKGGEHRLLQTPQLVVLLPDFLIPRELLKEVPFCRGPQLLREDTPLGETLAESEPR